MNKLTECRHYTGLKPCRSDLTCTSDCKEFDLIENRILIIKLGAIGDVIRTTALLAAIKRKHTKSHITWVVNRESVSLLKYNKSIDNVVAFDEYAPLIIGSRRFNVVYSLDKESGATGLAKMVDADLKFGFSQDDYGMLTIYNDEAQYALDLGLNNDLKFFRNTKTYQEYMAEAVCLDFQQDPIRVEVPQEIKKKVSRWLEEIGVKRESGMPVVGFNTGVGTVFRTKAWPVERYIELAKKLTSELNSIVLLLGGPNEEKRNKEIKFKGGSLLLVDVGCNHSLLEFAAILDSLDLLLTSDTMAMHLAIAMETAVVAMFGSTCQQEIDLQKRGVKIFKELSCSPCYKGSCETLECMNAITADEIFETIKMTIKR